MSAAPAFVLAGGQSLRMGRDKSQLTLGGLTLLERALNLLRRAGFTPSVAGLRTSVPCRAPNVADRFPSSGPLAGMEAALASIAGPPQPVLFVPVDLPLLPAAFLETLFHRAESSGALATVPLLGGQPQPLCAVYSSSLAPELREALGREDRKVMRVLEQLVPANRFDRFRVEALATLQNWHAPHRWFWNANTPAEWDELRILSYSHGVPPADTLHKERHDIP